MDGASHRGRGEHQKGSLPAHHVTLNTTRHIPFAIGTDPPARTPPSKAQRHLQPVLPFDAKREVLCHNVSTRPLHLPPYAHPITVNTTGAMTFAHSCTESMCCDTTLVTVDVEAPLEVRKPGTPAMLYQHTENGEQKLTKAGHEFMRVSLVKYATANLPPDLTPSIMMPVVSDMIVQNHGLRFTFLCTTRAAARSLQLVLNGVVWQRLYGAIEHLHATTVDAHSIVLSCDNIDTNGTTHVESGGEVVQRFKRSRRDGKGAQRTLSGVKSRHEAGRTPTQGMKSPLVMRLLTPRRNKSGSGSGSRSGSGSGSATPPTRRHLTHATYVASPTARRRLGMGDDDSDGVGGVKSFASMSSAIITGRTKGVTSVPVRQVGVEEINQIRRQLQHTRLEEDPDGRGLGPMKGSPARVSMCASIATSIASAVEGMPVEKSMTILMWAPVASAEPAYALRDLNPFMKNVRRVENNYFKSGNATPTDKTMAYFAMLSEVLNMKNVCVVTTLGAMQQAGIDFQGSVLAGATDDSSLYSLESRIIEAPISNPDAVVLSDVHIPGRKSIVTVSAAMLNKALRGQLPMRADGTPPVLGLTVGEYMLVATKTVSVRDVAQIVELLPVPVSISTCASPSRVVTPRHASVSPAAHMHSLHDHNNHVATGRLPARSPSSQTSGESGSVAATTCTMCYRVLLNTPVTGMVRREAMEKVSCALPGVDLSLVPVHGTHVPQKPAIDATRDAYSSVAVLYEEALASTRTHKGRTDAWHTNVLRLGGHSSTSDDGAGPDTSKVGVSNNSIVATARQMQNMEAALLIAKQHVTSDALNELVSLYRELERHIPIGQPIIPGDLLCRFLDQMERPAINPEWPILVTTNMDTTYGGDGISEASLCVISIVPCLLRAQAPALNPAVCMVLDMMHLHRLLESPANANSCFAALQFPKEGCHATRMLKHMLYNQQRAVASFPNVDIDVVCDVLTARMGFLAACETFTRTRSNTIMARVRAACRQMFGDDIHGVDFDASPASITRHIDVLVDKVNESARAAADNQNKVTTANWSMVPMAQEEFPGRCLRSIPGIGGRAMQLPAQFGMYYPETTQSMPYITGTREFAVTVFPGVLAFAVKEQPYVVTNRFGKKMPGPSYDSHDVQWTEAVGHIGDDPNADASRPSVVQLITPSLAKKYLGYLAEGNTQFKGPPTSSRTLETQTKRVQLLLRSALADLEVLQKKKEKQEEEGGEPSAVPGTEDGMEDIDLDMLGETEEVKVDDLDASIAKTKELVKKRRSQVKLIEKRLKEAKQREEQQREDAKLKSIKSGYGQSKRAVAQRGFVDAVMAGVEKLERASKEFQASVLGHLQKTMPSIASDGSRLQEEAHRLVQRQEIKAVITNTSSHIRDILSHTAVAKRCLDKIKKSMSTRRRAFHVPRFTADMSDEARKFAVAVATKAQKVRDNLVVDHNQFASSVNIVAYLISIIELQWSDASKNGWKKDMAFRVYPDLKHALREWGDVCTILNGPRLTKNGRGIIDTAGCEHINIEAFRMQMPSAKDQENLYNQFTQNLQEINVFLGSLIDGAETLDRHMRHAITAIRQKNEADNLPLIVTPVSLFDDTLPVTILIVATWMVLHQYCGSPERLEETVNYVAGRFYQGAMWWKAVPYIPRQLQHPKGALSVPSLVRRVNELTKGFYTSGAIDAIGTKLVEIKSQRVARWDSIVSGDTQENQRVVMRAIQALRAELTRCQTMQQSVVNLQEERESTRSVLVTLHDISEAVTPLGRAVVTTALTQLYKKSARHISDMAHDFKEEEPHGRVHVRSKTVIDSINKKLRKMQEADPVTDRAIIDEALEVCRLKLRGSHAMPIADISLATAAGVCGMPRMALSGVANVLGLSNVHMNECRLLCPAVHNRFTRSAVVTVTPNTHMCSVCSRHPNHNISHGAKLRQVAVQAPITHERRFADVKCLAELAGRHATMRITYFPSPDEPEPVTDTKAEEAEHADGESEDADMEDDGDDAGLLDISVISCATSDALVSVHTPGRPDVIQREYMGFTGMGVGMDNMRVVMPAQSTATAFRCVHMGVDTTRIRDVLGLIRGAIRDNPSHRVIANVADSIQGTVCGTRPGLQADTRAMAVDMVNSLSTFIDNFAFRYMRVAVLDLIESTARPTCSNPALSAGQILRRCRLVMSACVDEGVMQPGVMDVAMHLLYIYMEYVQSFVTSVADRAMSAVGIMHTNTEDIKKGADAIVDLMRQPDERLWMMCSFDPCEGHKPTSRRLAGRVAIDHIVADAQGVMVKLKPPNLGVLSFGEQGRGGRGMGVEDTDDDTDDDADGPSVTMPLSHFMAWYRLAKDAAGFMVLPADAWLHNNVTERFAMKLLESYMSSGSSFLLLRAWTADNTGRSRPIASTPLVPKDYGMRSIREQMQRLMRWEAGCITPSRAALMRQLFATGAEVSSFCLPSVTVCVATYPYTHTLARQVRNAFLSCDDDTDMHTLTHHISFLTRRARAGDVAVCAIHRVSGKVMLAGKGFMRFSNEARLSSPPPRAQPRAPFVGVYESRVESSSTSVILAELLHAELGPKTASWDASHSLDNIPSTSTSTTRFMEISQSMEHGSAVHTILPAATMSHSSGIGPLYSAFSRGWKATTSRVPSNGRACMAIMLSNPMASV